MSLVCTPVPQLTEHSLQFPRFHMEHSESTQDLTAVGLAVSGQRASSSLHVTLRYCFPSPQLAEHSFHAPVNHTAHSRILHISLWSGLDAGVHVLKVQTTLRSLAPSPQVVEQGPHSSTSHPEHCCFKHGRIGAGFADSLQNNSGWIPSHSTVLP